MILPKPDWVDEIHETGPNSIVLITSYEATRQPVTRIKIVVWKSALAQHREAGYFASIEREVRMPLGKRLVSVWEILGEDYPICGSTPEEAFRSLLPRLSPDTLLSSID